MKMMGRLTVLIAPVLLAACAAAPEEGSYMSQLQEQYKQLSAQEQVRLAAASELLNAQEALDAAAGAGDAAERDHQLYLARQYLALTEAAAERREVRMQTRALAEEQQREQLRQAEQRAEMLESELAALETKQTRRGVIVMLNDVFFETDQAELQPGAASTMEKLASYMEEHPDQEMIIEGHTDSRGPAQYNQRLSRRRAQSVKSAIVARGVASERIRTQGYGEEKPIASNATSGGRQLNRRVEIVLPQGGS